LALTFVSNWNGMGTPILWPPNSLDLKPSEFLVQEHVKSSVYGQQPDSLCEPKAKI